MHSNIEKYNLLDCVTYEKFPLKLPECDIVFCQFGALGKKIFEMPHLFEWLKKRKVVVCLRGGSDLKAYGNKKLNFYQQLLKKVDLFLPVCDYFRRQLIAFGCYPHKIAVHHSAIDCSQFFFTVRQKPENEIIQLVSVCRLAKRKGIDYAIKAVVEILKKYKQIHYTIVGEGPERTYLEALIQQFNLQDYVTLHGWETHDKLVAILDRSHIFLSPSITESNGNEEGIANALKEAMAMGLISVGTQHAGTPELIDHGISGFLVSEKSVSELADTVEYIIEHPEQWKSIGLAARKKIEDEFETKQSIEKLEKIFYTLLKIQ
jgi:colanic acid/amylovoran biosynthesis glycosyltransferase